MLHCVKKIGLSLYLRVRNQQCLRRGGRSLFSSHKNRASPCQWLFDWLLSGHQSVNPSREAISILSGKIQKIYVCPPCVLAGIQYLQTSIVVNLCQTQWNGLHT